MSFPYQVGDEFEASTHTLSGYIRDILSVGGKFEFTGGKSIRITYLPESVAPPAPAPEPEPEVEPAPKPRRAKKAVEAEAPAEEPQTAEEEGEDA